VIEVVGLLPSVITSKAADGREIRDCAVLPCLRSAKQACFGAPAFLATLQYVPVVEKHLLTLHALRCALWRTEERLQSRGGDGEEVTGPDKVFVLAQEARLG
jgi:hypothetical protein